MVHRHELRQTSQHRARSLKSKTRLPPGVQALQPDGRRRIAEDFGIYKPFPAWVVATYGGKVLDYTHVDGGRIYGRYSAGNEVGEGEGYRWVDVGDQVIPVGESAYAQ